MKRLNVITLGVADLGRARAFYEGLFGWQPKDEPGDEPESIVFYNQGGWMLALFPR